jgi:hypothetical protein
MRFWRRTAQFITLIGPLIRPVYESLPCPLVLYPWAFGKPMFAIWYQDHSGPWGICRTECRWDFMQKGRGRRIRTFGWGFSPYNGLAIRHSSRTPSLNSAPKLNVRHSLAERIWLWWPGGLIPLTLGKREPGKEVQQPISVVILRRIATSTLLNIVVLSALYLCYNFATKQASRRRRLFSFMHYSQGGNLVWIQVFAVYGTLFKMPETGF